ncbi:MAG: PEP-CTERM sorting domain-containing protein [Verrucomicrobiota bacterium JB022]|nr:PEP-CTERM sorting domain-containing protein [Verrucomicrobiota bacterium JB022]
MSKIYCCKFLSAFGITLVLANSCAYGITFEAMGDFSGEFPKYPGAAGLSADGTVAYFTGIYGEQPSNNPGGGVVTGQSAYRVQWGQPGATPIISTQIQGGFEAFSTDSSGNTAYGRLFGEGIVQWKQGQGTQRLTELENALTPSSGPSLYSLSKMSGDGNWITGTTSLSASTIFRWSTATNTLETYTNTDYEITRVHGVNQNGSVMAGSAWNWMEAPTPVIWTEASGFTTLSTGNGEALAVTRDGMTAIGHLNGFGFQWSAESGTTMLEGFADSTASRANAIDDSATFVVGSASFGEATEAVIWINGQIYSLYDILIDQGFDLIGWTLTSANGISADGSVIIGNGIDPNGKSSPWMIRGYTPLIPEPSTYAALAGLGALGLLAWRRRQ